MLHYVFTIKHNYDNFFFSIANANFDYFLGFLNKPGVVFYISLICIPPTHTLYVEYK